MKLEALTPELLRRALEIYVAHAWPEKQREKLPALRAGHGEALLSDFKDEGNRKEGKASRRYALRLGNARYPHMKFVLEEHFVAGEFIFSVDTHDELEIRPDFPDYAGWQALKDHNRALKARIEESWHAAGVQTYRDLAEILRGDRRPAASAGRGVTVLVVDDQREIADAVATILIQDGYDVLLAHDGQEAVETAIRERPRAILMDYQMPRMDGVEAAIRIRQFLPRSLCLILLATAALIDLSAVQEADGFLLKPYSREFLLSFLQAVLHPAKT